MDSDAARVRVRYLVEEEVAARSWSESRSLFRHMGVTVCTLARQAPVSSAAARLRETAMEDPPQKRLERLVCIRGLVPGALSACFSRRLRDSRFALARSPRGLRRRAPLSRPRTLYAAFSSTAAAPLFRGSLLRLPNTPTRLASIGRLLSSAVCALFCLTETAANVRPAVAGTRASGWIIHACAEIDVSIPIIALCAHCHLLLGCGAPVLAI